MVSFWIETIFVAARCQAIGCFSGCPAPISKGVRCYLAANNSENSKTPIEPLDTERRAISGGNK
jgi:hypothetical protein